MGKALAAAVAAFCVFAATVVPVSAHVAAVCSSVETQAAGSSGPLAVRLWLGTYHSISNNTAADGQLRVSVVSSNATGEAVLVFTKNATCGTGSLLDQSNDAAHFASVLSSTCGHRMAAGCPLSTNCTESAFVAPYVSGANSSFTCYTPENADHYDDEAAPASPSDLPYCRNHAWMSNGGSRDLGTWFYQVSLADS